MGNIFSFTGSSTDTPAHPDSSVRVEECSGSGKNVRYYFTAPTKIYPPTRPDNKDECAEEYVL